MSLLSKNLGYFLWRFNNPWGSWVSVVAEWAKCDTRRARELLAGRAPTDTELYSLGEILRVDPSELSYQDLFSYDSSIDILRENLKRLLDDGHHGRKRELANKLGIDPITLSRWLAGTQKPRLGIIKKIISEFHIPSEIDLARDPLFIRFEPIGIYEQRIWLHQRIEKLDGETLSALHKLLEKTDKI